jgi:hypothetical protein
VTFGGSFLGSFTLNSKSASGTQDINAFAKLSGSKGLFSASGSEDFQHAVSQSNGRVSIFADADWKGGTDIDVDLLTQATPESMGKMFKQWGDSWRSSPEPLTVETRRWIDSADVQEIVNTMSAQDADLFYMDDISPITQREISEENSELMKVETSLKLALSWIATQNDRAMRSCLEQLNRDVLTKRLEVNLLDEADVLIIQNQFLNRDYSWFEADHFRERYLSCVPHDLESLWLHGEVGTNRCPSGSVAIEDAGACQTAANSLSLTWEKSGNWPDWQTNCHSSKGKAYFNSHPTGAAHSDGQSICQVTDTECPAGYLRNNQVCIVPPFIEIKHVTGKVSYINGRYKLSNTNYQGRAQWQNVADPDKWLVLFPSSGYWSVCPSSYKDANKAGGWMESDTKGHLLPTSVPSWVVLTESEWQIQNSVTVTGFMA